MTSTFDGQPLPSLQQLAAASLDRLDQINDKLGQLVRSQLDNGAAIDEIRDMVKGFTNDGASFGAYQTDCFTTAYLAVLGPMLAFRLSGELQNKLIPELLKAGAPLARDLLEELAAYRQQQLGRDTLENTIGTMRDPWAENAVPEEGDWKDLAESS